MISAQDKPKALGQLVNFIKILTELVMILSLFIQ